MFHELVHSTGHVTRLNRSSIANHNPFGSKDYNKEELVAEIGVSFLCGVTGIERETIDNSTSYIQSWLRALRDDVKMVVIAAGHAQKAVDYITGK
ncbi:zincin-like metallopeptidase domain-containing protein [Candidatus Latescibacterota bacterium]